MGIVNSDRLYIGGKWVPAKCGNTIGIVTPATEEPFAEVAEAQEVDIAAAVAAARCAFDKGEWPQLSHAERARYLHALSNRLLEGSGQIARDWVNEMGIVLPAAEGVAGWSGSIYQYYASLADSFPFEEIHDLQSGKFGLLVREPVGVVGAIVPWNAPPLIIAYKVAPALLAGCTIILKAAPEAPSAAYALANAADAVGLPPGVLNVVTAEREASEALVRNHDVDKITFTGSSLAGKRIASICGERIARCTLELGGKSAAVILDDADIDKAADVLTENAALMTGQVCAALTRVIVDRSRHDALVDALADRFRGIAVGDPLQQGTQMGPLAMKRQRDRVFEYIETGSAEGANLVAGGGAPAGLDRGYYVAPTLFANVDNRSRIAQEEIFGPVLSVIPSDSEQQAVNIANDSNFGLSGSVFTADPDRAYAVARQMRTGTVGQDGHATDFFNIAFGGFKQSGIGREGGVEGMHPFLEVKSIVLDSAPTHLRKG